MEMNTPADDMDYHLAARFEGFAWGSRWAGGNKDPMHSPFVAEPNQQCPSLVNTSSQF